MKKSRPLTLYILFPVVGLVLILPIDWFVGIGRAVTNLIGAARA